MKIPGSLRRWRPLMKACSEFSPVEPMLGAAQNHQQGELG